MRFSKGFRTQGLPYQSKIGLTITFALLIAISGINGANAEVIEGNTVSVDTAKVFFNATPHTLHFWDEWVNFNLVSKQFSGEIDVVFGFNTSIIKPKSAYLNTQNGWIDVSDHFNKVSFDHGGMDSWYFVKKWNVNSGQNYNFKIRFNITQKGNGKYWVCAKPSAQSLSQAKANGNLLCLDPWYETYYARFGINVSCATCSDEVTVPVMLFNASNRYFVFNESGEGSTPQYVWANITMNSSHITRAYLYYNNESDYVVTDADSTNRLFMRVENGSGYDFGALPYSGDLVGWWMLGDCSGTTCFDSSDKQINGTKDGSTSPINTTSKYDGGQYFDGSNKITITDQPFYDGLGQISFNGHILHNTKGVFQSVVTKWDGAGSYSGISWVVQVMNTERLNCRIVKTTGNICDIATLGGLSNNTEYDFACRYNGSTCELWVDGVLEASALGTGTITASALDVFIGAQKPSAPTFFYNDGKIDNIMIWDDVLTHDEIKAMHTYSMTFSPTEFNVTPTPPEPEPTVFNVTNTSQTFCWDSDTLYIRTSETETNGTGQIVTMYQEWFTCPNGCSNSTIFNFGNAGCNESEIMQVIIFIIMILIIGLMIRKVN